MSETKYQIMERKRDTEYWNLEKFYTGGWSFSFDRAVKIKDNLMKICKDIQYEIKQVF